MRQIAFIVIGCILLLLSPIAAIGGKVVFDNSNASAEWPATSGTIISSELNAHPVSRRKAKANIRYEFSVNERRYSGDRIRFVDTSGNGKSIQQGILDTYPIGKQVEVFYQPDKPSNCVLVRGGGAFAFLVFLPLLLLLGLGGTLLVAGILGMKANSAKNKRTQKRSPARRPPQRPRKVRR